MASLSLAAAAFSAGCQYCLIGASQETPTCNSGGQVTLTAPPGFAPSSPPKIDLGQSCLSAQGDCSFEPVFGIGTDAVNFKADDFYLTVTLPTTQGAASYALPSPAVFIYGAFDGDDRPFTTMSGNIAVQTSTLDALVATFSIQLGAPTGVTFTLDGQVNVTDCHLVEGCSF